MPRTKRRSNNNKKKKRTPGRKAKVVALPQRLPISQEAKSIATRVCSITDPFCVHAIGAKYPDSSSVPTLPFTFRGRYTASTNAAGNVGFLLLPGFDYQFASDTVVTTPPTIVPTNLLTLAAITFVPSQYRIVTAGLRLRCIAPALTAQGMVRIRHFGNPTGGSGLTSINASSFNAALTADIPLKDCLDVVIPLRRIGANATEFVRPTDTNTSSTVSGWVSPGWGAVSIYVDGGPASLAALDIEAIFNYELRFSDGDTMNAVTTPATPIDNTVTQISSQITTGMKGGFLAGAEQFGRYVADKALATATNFVAQRLGFGVAKTATSLARNMRAITVD